MPATVCTPHSRGRFWGGCNFSKLGWLRCKADNPAESTTIKAAGRVCKDRRKWLPVKDLRRWSAAALALRRGDWLPGVFQSGGKYLQRFAYQHAAAAGRDGLHPIRRKPFSANHLRRDRIAICQLGIPLPTLWHGGCFKSLQRRTAERQPSGWNRKSHARRYAYCRQPSAHRGATDHLGRDWVESRPGFPPNSFPPGWGRTDFPLPCGPLSFLAIWGRRLACRF